MADIVRQPDARRTARGFYERLGGRLVAEKTEIVRSYSLKEVAYGWKWPHNAEDAVDKPE
jgi:hypothetical protein